MLLVLLLLLDHHPGGGGGALLLHEEFIRRLGCYSSWCWVVGIVDAAAVTTRMINNGRRRMCQ